MNYYSIEEIASMSGYSQKTIRRHIAADKLKADKIGNSYRITEQDYQRWMQSDKKIDDESIFCGEVEKASLADDVNWIDITDEWVYDGWSNVNHRNGLNFIDLFSGLGRSSF